MRTITIIATFLLAACGQTIKTKNEHTYHFDPIKIEASPIVISGEVYIKLISTLTNDPIIKDLINNACQGKLTCNEQTIQDLINSISAGLVSSGTLEQPIKSPL